MKKQLEYLNKLYSKAKILTDGDFEECEALRTSAYASLEAIFGQNSIYVKQLEKRMKGHASAWLKSTRAILKSALEDIENGALQKFEYSIVVGTLESFLFQAKQLNKGGDSGKKSASVLLSAVFEDFLSKLCDNKGFEIPNNSQSKIDLLKSNSVINPIQASRLSSIKEIRNLSFHAKWDQFSNAEVGKCINDLEDIMSETFDKN